MVARDIEQSIGTKRGSFSYRGGVLAMRKNRWFVLLALFGICTLLYYFGQIIDYFNWGALKWEFFYEPHDTHRLFFFIPIAYACYFFGFRQMAIVTAASLVVFLPRAIFVSPFPDSLLRAMLFTVFAVALCLFIRIGRHKIQQQTGGEAVFKNGTNAFAGVPNSTREEIFTSGDLEVNLSMRLVKQHERIVKLTPKEYELLSYMVRNAGKALKHVELLRNVWGPEYGRESEYLHTFISQLRHKIENDPSNPRFIVTEPGVGYRFVQPERYYR
jgi:DNA-binding winged helix-turn-helix (wHTH) protein